MGKFDFNPLNIFLWHLAICLQGLQVTHLPTCRSETHHKCLKVITMHQPNFEIGKSLWTMTPNRHMTIQKVIWDFFKEHSMVYLDNIFVKK